MMAAGPTRRRARVAVLALASALGLAGCQEIFNSIFDTAAPTGVSASDGEHPDSIEVSWGTPSLTSDKWKGYEISGYDLSWDGPGADPGFVSGNSCSIRVDSFNRATEYLVTVTTRFKGGSSGGSASDEGFALDTEPLLWADGGRPYAIAGVDRWYVTMLQKGFTYTFDFPAATTGPVEFCPYKSLERLHTIPASGSSQAWTCDEDGAANKFFVHVAPGAPTTFIASYGF
jgi:hypothetical protein